MPLNERVKNTLSFLLRMGISVGLLVYVFSLIDLEKTAELIRSADKGFLFWAGTVFLVNNLILLWRWFIFIKALDLKVTKSSVTLHYFYGLFGNLFLPTAIGGDVIKAVGLCQNSSEKPKVVASVLIDRLSGFVAIALVAVLAFVLGFGYINDIMLIIPIVLMAAAITTILSILLIEPVYALFCRLFDRFPKFKDSLMKMHYDIAVLKQSHKTKEAYKAVAVSCFGQVIYAVTFYLVAQSLQQDISLIYFLIFVPMLCVVSSLPSISGLGVTELGSTYLFGRIGVEPGIAVSLTLTIFLFRALIGLVGGMLYVYTLSTRRVQYRTPDAGVKAGPA